MQKIETVKAQTRKAAGSRAAQRLRRSGMLPAIIYGHQQDPEAVSLNYHEVEQQIRHGAHLVNLDIQGKVQPCLFKEAQYDHLGERLLHLDLSRVDLNERVTVHVAIELRGTPKGVGEGGVLRQELSDLELECLVTNIPDVVRVNVSDLALDQVLYVKDLKLDEGIVAKTDGETVVAMVRQPAVHAEPTAEGAAAEGAAEPEVIAKGKVEAEGEEEKPKEKAKEKA